MGWHAIGIQLCLCIALLQWFSTLAENQLGNVEKKLKTFLNVKELFGPQAKPKAMNL